MQSLCIHWLDTSVVIPCHWLWVLVEIMKPSCCYNEVILSTKHRLYCHVIWIIKSESISCCIYEGGFGMYRNVAGMIKMLHNFTFFTSCGAMFSSNLYVFKVKRKESSHIPPQKHSYSCQLPRIVNYSCKLSMCILCCAAYNRLFISSSKPPLD